MEYKYLNGKLVECTTEEIDAIEKSRALIPSKKDAISDKIRNERNNLLSESDWRVIRDIEPNSTVSKAVKDYRQALRDLPNHPDFPNVEFPVKPEGK